jgi:ubiquitin C-terminal hydrolase
MGTATKLIPTENNPISLHVDETEEVHSLEKQSPIGLKNFGNTCYFNSVVQLISLIPELKDKISRYNTNYFCI